MINLVVKKNLSYALMHLCVAFAVAYMLTGNLSAALAVGIIEPFFQTIAYHFHEKFWNREKYSDSSLIGNTQPLLPA